MLLSIERVLLLLSEGKSVEKIAEMVSVRVEDIYQIILEARDIVLESGKQRAKKKIILKKTIQNQDEEKDVSPSAGKEKLAEMLLDAELAAVPLSSSLIMYVDGASSGNPGPAGIGIVIMDGDNRQVGKVSSYIGKATNNYAEYTALIRAMKIALYFKTKNLRIRTDSELVVKQLSGEYKVKNDNIRDLYEEAVSLKKKIGNVKIEHVSRNFNDKADHLARKAVAAHKQEEKNR